MEISDIKLRVNHNVNFNLEDTKIKNLLIIGNTINFFGFFNDGRINMMSMNKNDRYHYMWLLKRCKEKTNIYIIGESEEKEYYINLFNYIGSLGIKVNCKFMETKEPKDYLEYLKKISLLKNMKFDYIVGNPPYDDGISKGLQKNLHLKCVEKCLNIFTNKMIIIMPIKFIQNNSEKLKYFKNIFNNTLKSVKEYNSNYFVGTGMPNVAVYEFDKNKKNDDCIEIQYIDNNIIKTQSLLNNNYDSNITEILSYLETDKNYMNWLYLGSDKNNLSNSYNNQINIKLPKQIRYKNLIKSNNPSFIVCNAANGGMTGTYFTQKTNYICEGTTNLINYLINRGGGVATILYFNNLISANNCKLALERPLLRFACYISQIDQNMKGRVYKYIPNINWEDERCLTDEGLLEMCGCPKDKAKEYAEYVKNYVEERDKEFENRKKNKKK